jgi:hypothetical protein
MEAKNQGRPAETEVKVDVVSVNIIVEMTVHTPHIEPFIAVTDTAKQLPSKL